MERSKFFQSAVLTIKTIISVCIVIISLMVGFVAFILSSMVSNPSDIVLCFVGIIALPSLLPFFWLKKRKIYLIAWLAALIAITATYAILFSIEERERELTIDVTPNINVSEYLPFVDDSKIVKLDSKTLKLTGDLPIIDGATAAFPVYSAFVNAVYPETTKLNDGVFEYNTTTEGYKKLAEKKTDIFLGAPPSKEQIEYATQNGTTFKYTQIGSEAFVFFVHKDNPVDTLTVEQIKGIYSGRITNWSEVGGNDEEIVAFQRDEGSGSQSMLIRFMEGEPIMAPETKEIKGMGMIIEEVVDYQNKSGSIGFSFRYYLEGIIKNPDIKMIAVDGVAPNVENIKNNAYPVVTPVYAVTYEDNPNPNVEVLVEWMLSDEGQYIIEQSGYVGVRKK